MNYRIPTTSRLSSFTQIVTLDGEQYGLRFLWNARAERWFLSVSDAEGLPLITGRKLCSDRPWAAHETLATAPPGKLWVYATGGGDADPGLRDLGERVAMMYVDKAGSA